MPCAGCGAELLPGKRFCHECGARAPVACAGCGAALAPGYRFCPDCGRPAGVALPPPGPGPATFAPVRCGVEGERKIVTVVFCDIAGSTGIAQRLDAEEYRDLLRRYFEIALAEVYRYDGVVTQLAGDGFMALFGAPVAREDAPERAVRAALAMRDRVARFAADLRERRGIDWKVRTGIHTGPVVVGTVGTEVKLDYTAIGDTTNLAARLESLATPGAILMSEATYRLVRDRFEVRPTGSLDVRGRSEPVAGFEVLGLAAATSPLARAATRGLTPFVGRTAELEALLRVWRRLPEEGGQAVVVVGAAGAGKSRIVFELEQRVVDQAAAALEGRCSSMTRDVPYAPFLAMVRTYFGVEPGESRDGACAKVGARLGVDGAAVLAEYPMLSRILAMQGMGESGVPADELKRETFDAVTNLVRGRAWHGPVLVVLEDLQWMDEASHELLARLLDRLGSTPVLVVVTARPRSAGRWNPRVPVTTLPLAPLVDSDVLAIVRSVVATPLGADVEAAVVAKAGGSPFFAEELARAVAESGTGAVTIPDTVQEVIAARLDRLPPDAKRVIQVAAVVGRQVSATELEHLFEGDAVDVPAALALLVDRGLLHRMRARATEYRFGESLTQEVAYETLLVRQRRQLHERYARLLAESSDDGSAERAARLAHHWERTDDHAQAARALLEAGRTAERLPAYPVAADFFVRAWRAAEAGVREGGEDACRPLVLAATNGICGMSLFFGVPGLEDSEGAVRRGRELAEATGDTEAIANFTYAQSVLRLQRSPGEFDAALALGEEAFATAERGGHRLAAIRIARGLALTYAADGRFAVAERTIARAIEELDRDGHRERRTDLYLGMRWARDNVVFQADQLARAEALLRETHGLAVARANRTVQTATGGVLAQLCFLQGRYADVLAWADAALEIGETIGNLALLAPAASVALAARIALGRDDGRARLLDQIEQGMAVTGPTQPNVRFVGEALLDAGELARAEAWAQYLLGRRGGRLRGVIAETTAAQVAAAAGRLDEAGDRYAEAIALAGTIGARSHLAIAHAGLARLEALRGHPAGAVAHARVALPLVDALALERYRPVLMAAPGREAAGMPPAS